MACGKTFRVGVFFDGTGNDKADPRSNVAELSELYDLSDNLKMPCKAALKTAMIYRAGVGTGDDVAVGGATGRGGAQRINEVIDEVLKHFDSYSEKEWDRIIDVFGFSRGAALARDFVNTFNIKHSDEECEFGFIGLFDTVGSFGIAGNDINLKPIDPSQHSEADPDVLAYEAGISQPGSPSQKNLHQNFEKYNFNLSASSAHRVIQLVAADEYRENFPLHDISGAGPDHKMIGVHSDIGGGYPPITNEYASYRPGKNYYANLFTMAKQGAAADREAKAEEVKLNAEERSNSKWQCKTKSEPFYGTGIIGRIGTVYYVSCEQTRTVTNDLQKVSLAAMYTQALMNGVPFKPPNQFVPPDLQSYLSAAISKLAQANNYHSRDEILDTYAHRSAVDTEELSHHRDADPVDKLSWDELKKYGADSLGNKMRYNRGKPQRMVFNNRPSDAKIII